MDAAVNGALAPLRANSSKKSSSKNDGGGDDSSSSDEGQVCVPVISVCVP
jgi:hypothetical protein